MGLDVYLYHYSKPVDEVVAAGKSHEEAREAASDEAVKATGAAKYEAMTAAQREDYSARMDAWREAHPEPDSTSEHIEIDSRVYPKNMTKIGYLRSSYNRGGLNHVLDAAIGKGLDYIFFGPDGERAEYVVRPDWAACLKRAIEVRDEYARTIASNGPYAVIEYSANAFRGRPPAESEQEAMAIFQRERAKNTGRPDDFANYSNADGTFYMGTKGIEVVGVIMGTTSMLETRPCAYLIHRLDESERDPQESAAGPFGWYRAATEIVVEMIEWVLSKPDTERYALHWSG